MKDEICGYTLDQQQQSIVLDDSNYLLVVAGAGSGKTLTILGKIYYLIKYKKVSPDEIICISFTRSSANDIRLKIRKEFDVSINVYTFHSLALEIINIDKKYEIALEDTLSYVIDLFFSSYIFNSNYHIKILLKYLNLKKLDEYEKLIRNNAAEIKELKNTIHTFIRLFKTNNYKLYDFSNFLKISRGKIFNFSYKKEKIFLILCLNVFLLYQKHLEDNRLIDFDDILIKATEFVNENGIDRKIKYVFIDEYQDCSLIRFNFIKSILIYTNSKLMAVGDDFQSIYRFTGCDINLFLNFKRIFNNSKMMKIENTYRNSQELINIAGDFVMKNNRQITKHLVSNKHLNTPIIIKYYSSLKKEFLQLILNIHNEFKNDILVLGRNNTDINDVLSNELILEGNKVIYLKNKNINITFLTVHKSKGLEASNVIILNMNDDILGFPCKIVDNKFLRFVSTRDSLMPYDEERRLMYVALTRTKNYVYLLTNKKSPSIFVKELRKYKKVKIC